MCGKTEKKLVESEVAERGGGGMGWGLGRQHYPFRAEKRNEHARVLASRWAPSFEKKGGNSVVHVNKRVN